MGKTMTMGINEEVLIAFREFKVHPRETDNDCLARLIEKAKTGDLKPIPPGTILQPITLQPQIPSPDTV